MVLLKDKHMFPFLLPVVEEVSDGTVPLKLHSASLVTQLLTLDRFGLESGLVSLAPPTLTGLQLKSFQLLVSPPYLQRRDNHVWSRTL